MPELQALVNELVLAGYAVNSDLLDPDTVHAVACTGAARWLTATLLPQSFIRLSTPTKTCTMDWDAFVRTIKGHNA